MFYVMYSFFVQDVILCTSLLSVVHRYMFCVMYLFFVQGVILCTSLLSKVSFLAYFPLKN